MQSLQDLNTYGKTKIIFVDDRDYNVLTLLDQTVDQSIAIFENQTFNAPVGIEVTEIIDHVNSLPTYEFNFTSISGTTIAYGDDLPSYITIDNSTADIFIVEGMRDVDDWNIVKNPIVTLPYATTGSQSFTTSLKWSTADSTNYNKTTNIDISITSVAYFSEPSEFNFPIGNDRSFTAPTLVTDTGTFDPTFTLTITSSNSAVISDINATASGSAVVTKVSAGVTTIVGDKTDVNATLATITADFADSGDIHQLTYSLTNDLNSNIEIVIQDFRTTYATIDISVTASVDNPVLDIISRNNNLENTFTIPDTSYVSVFAQRFDYDSTNNNLLIATQFKATPTADRVIRAYIYSYSGGSWSLSQTLDQDSPNSALEPFSPTTVAIDSDYAVVGIERFFNGGHKMQIFDVSTGNYLYQITVPEFNERRIHKIKFYDGRLYVLVKEETPTYNPVLLVYTLGSSSATLNTTVTLPVDCSSMDIANDKIVIGAPAWENASSEVRGRAYVYSTDTTPSLLYTIDNPQDVDDNFGSSVALNNNYYFISAHESNRVYMFNTDGTYHATINNPNLYDTESDSTTYNVYDYNPLDYVLDGHNDNFGLKISVSGDILCIAAPTEENYNDSNNNGIVYFYDLSAQNLVYSGYREAGSIDSSYTNETLGLGDILIKGTDIFVNNGSDYTAGKLGTKLYHLTYTG